MRTPKLLLVLVLAAAALGPAASVFGDPLGGAVAQASASAAAGAGAGSRAGSAAATAGTDTTSDRPCPGCPQGSGSATSSPSPSPSPAAAAPAAVAASPAGSSAATPAVTAASPASGQDRLVSTRRTWRPGAGPPAAVYLGATTYDLAINEWTPWTALPPDVQTFEHDAGRRLGVVMWYASWAQNSFSAAQASAVAQHGSVPEITWEPWDTTNGTANQPAYSLATIISGGHDAYIQSYASAVKAYGGPVRLRFAHEMNGTAYPWAEAVNGNQPGQYAAAWRHVHDIFTSLGVTNVTWIWCPNSGPTTSFAELYPGDAYVDLAGIDGYNGGTAIPAWGGWRTFDTIFGPPLAQLRAAGITKLVTISETASTESGGSKAAWITDMFSWLAAHPDVVAFNWFNLNQAADWPIESSAAATSAFAAGAADPRYGGA